MSTTTTTTTSAPSSTIPLTTTKPPHSGPVDALLNFYVPPADGARPYNYVEQPPEGVPQSNYSIETKTVTISDIRGKESDFSLDKNAFLAVRPNDITKNSSADFSSDEAVQRTYYPEIEELLLNTLPGSPKRVLIFDHTIRRALPGSSREPVMRTHIDQTDASARARVYHHLPAEADELVKGRYRLVNVWRPLNGPVETAPLAVADSTTVRDDILVGIEHRYPDRTGETAGLRYDAAAKWWYWSGIDNDERLLLQCYDSESHSRVPHSAFHLPDEEGRKHRESIEVRALIFG